VQNITDTLAVGELECDGQALHDALPVPPLYVPARHPAHVLPSFPVKPALQTQAVLALLAKELTYELSGHVEHVALPVSLLYLPGAQSVHVPPLTPL